MNRRKFLSVTGSFTGGALLMPQFLHALPYQKGLASANQCVLFIQLNGGNDGLNTFIPYDNPLYYANRPNIGIAKDRIIAKSKGMGFHPALKGLATIQQEGYLDIIQNVGYPNPNRSHFRSEEIWQTASSADTYLSHGWLGKYLDIQCKDIQPTAAINLDSYDNLALKGTHPNAMTIKNPTNLKTGAINGAAPNSGKNPQLDFVMKVAHATTEGSEEIQRALVKGKTELSYPNSSLGLKLKWIARLIKGNLNAKVYYSSLAGFDTHDNQLAIHERKLTELDEALYCFYQDLKKASLLEQMTIVVFSEFGRRVKDNGQGTDHGAAAPMFCIGGHGKTGRIFGDNPNLEHLEEGDIRYQIDFRSVYASILEKRMDFDPRKLGIQQASLAGF